VSCTPNSTGSWTTSKTSSPTRSHTWTQPAPTSSAFTAFPNGRWAQTRPNNPNERLNGDIRRRTDSVGIFPNREAIVRLVGAVLAEQTDEWAEGRRYLGLEILARCGLTLVPDTGNELTNPPLELSA